MKRYPGTPRLGLLLCVALAGYSASVPAQLSYQDRTNAVNATITNHSAAGQECDISFYWEIGDSTQKRGSGQKGTVFKASTNMAVYSATKWLYGAYVYQKRGGQLTAADKDALRMQSGYNTSNACNFSTTIGACQALMNTYDATADANNQYRYAGGHFQKHATTLTGFDGQAVSAKTKAQMVTEMQNYLGSNVVFTLNQPTMGAGAKTTATNYAVFLRKMLSGTLLLSGSALGSDAVCTYTGPTDAQTGRTNCPGSLYTPVATPPPASGEPDGGMNESFDYSIGHWVENDPVWLAGGGDAAYSSPGAAGFYPWIDSSRTWYGIIGRNYLSNTSAGESVKCGRLLRKAWITGIAQ